MSATEGDREALLAIMREPVPSIYFTVDRILAAGWRRADAGEVERLTRENVDLRQRVGFIESKVDIEDMPKSYGWAVNELTARKAYSKSECATLLAEQHHRATAAEAELAALRAVVEAARATLWCKQKMCWSGYSEGDVC